ncbi:MAG: hypothetical protein IJT97_03715 [Bacteroidaceae bacterium]|nr:hypothetical protein [Bacteroidaceae bacterium]
MNAPTLKTLCVLSLLCALCASCKEDKVNANLNDVTSSFLPAATDDSEEAQLRRTFHTTYNSFLLFNDTLQHYETGKDINGELHYFTETLDLTYDIGMSTYSNNKYTFTLMTDIDRKREAVQYVQDYLLTHITGKLMPYSWLLVDKITRDFIGSVSSPYAATGQRAVVIACNLLPKLTDAQKVQYTRQVMNTIIAKLATDNADAFAEFFAVSAAYYDGSFTDPKTTAANTAILNEAGFICRGQNFGSDTNGLYPSQELDLNAFARQVAATTPETFEKKYANYPLVLKKFEIMRRILLELGYKE